jgi:hypothetical protein
MKNLFLLKLCFVVFGALLAVQSVIAQTAGSLLNIEFQCMEVDRISISPKGQMQPAYPGRIVNVKIGENSVTANGVFFCNTYGIDQLENGDLRGNGRRENRDEVFYFHDSFLFHTAIVTNQNSKVIQSQILSCTRKK